MLAMSRVDLVFFLLLLKHANSAPQTGANTNAIVVTLQPPLPTTTIPPREAKPLPFYSTTQQHFAEPLPFYSTTQQPFAKPAPFHNTSTAIVRPLPVYTTSGTPVFHDDHNSLQNRKRRSIQSQAGTNTVVQPTPVAFRAVSSPTTTESFRDIVHVF
ncbi:hypothetical protein CBL_02300 [Carabus blaptoides fortunei]